MAVNELKTVDEFEKVIAENKLTLVDFYADWCGPCKMIAPVISELAKDRGDVNFVKINVDELQDLAQNYGILSIPTLITFQNGNELKRKTGFVTRNEIEQELLS
ncbi:thioredoxin [Spiroplasma sp. NBRC 100390]|uniref:thioredoxin n=1 Tax=unclassified Spiroplasma TaxID=2637901 RepID=UPI000892A450|nr:MULTISPECIES: thioredoxin [unclassified Spiroplasma]AOX44226.1 thioredoxin [Spiroplasma sp. TU-14]APE13696.1 thioredoxin [Spiroplasma sp. NBRC 100390]